jgi:hypothetical protein
VDARIPHLITVRRHWLSIFPGEKIEFYCTASNEGLPGAL